MNSVWQDLTYAARTLRARPGFTAAVVLSLALGIGACTAIFSVVDAVLLLPLPYPGADKLVSLTEVDARGRQTTFAEPNFFDVCARNHTLASVAEYNTGSTTTVLGGGEPVRAHIDYVSRDFFKTLGG